MKMLEQIRVGGKMVESPRGIVKAGAGDLVYQEFLGNLHVHKNDSLGQLVRLALAAHKDKRFHAFLELAMSEKGQTISLAAAAKWCEIGLIEFQAFWRDTQVNRSIMKAIDALPGLTDDLITDAKSTETPCPLCDGVGMVQREGKPDKVCPNCLGLGVVRTVGDKHARKTLLEMSGAIEKKPTVVINQDMRGLGMDSASTKLAAAVPFDLDVEPDPE